VNIQFPEHDQTILRQTTGGSQVQRITPSVLEYVVEDQHIYKITSTSQELIYQDIHDDAWYTLDLEENDSINTHIGVCNSSLLNQECCVFYRFP
jgi:hypothetical protein